MVIKRVGPVSCAKVTGILYAILGLVAGAFFSLFALVAGPAAASPGTSGGVGIFGVGAVIALPILYGIGGFVTALIMAWLYNGVAGAIGGIEIDLG